MQKKLRVEKHANSNLARYLITQNLPKERHPEQAKRVEGSTTFDTVDRSIHWKIPRFRFASLGMTPRWGVWEQISEGLHPQARAVRNRPKGGSWRTQITMDCLAAM
jgi:hypothetical protein